MARTAAIILAGGRSSRMGTPKAALDWHGSSLLARVTGLTGRAVDGPVVVVAAADQALPVLAPSVEIVRDSRDGHGPLEGLRAGLAAIGDRATIVYASSTDVPLLHPAFIRRVAEAIGSDADVALPEIGGYRQPLAAAYRVSLRPVLEELIAAELLKPAFLFERARVRSLDRAALLADPWLSRADPELQSVRNLNTPDDYARAQALPPPVIEVQEPGSLPEVGGRQRVRAWTLGGLAAATGLTLGADITPALNGEVVASEADLPLAAGDTVAFTG